MNGDGAGRGTHMSIYLVIQRGPYDSLLVWPFKHQVKVSILGPPTKSTHGQPAVVLSSSLPPDRKSPSYMRPTADANDGVGFPRFLQLTELDSKPDYVRDDTMFLPCPVSVEAPS